MDEREVERQLNQMRQFIIQEAQEKAAEILRKADEECALEKGRIIAVERQKIEQEYTRKRKQIEIQKKIRYANSLNETRLSILQARDAALRKILAEAQKQLGTISKSPSYKDLLKALIVQGLYRLGEKEVTVLVRQEDVGVVEAALDAAVNEYKAHSGVKDLKVTVEKRRFLPPGPESGKHETCAGGVILSAKEGRIVCSNTLDARLQLAFEGCLPQIRKTLFPHSLSTVAAAN